MTDPQRERQVWGDDPEERDASAAIAEFEAGGGRQGRWHDHWSIFPFKVVAKFIGRNAKRVAVTIAGFALIIAGIAMLVLPGPGWAAIFLGLAVLATEYVWAQRLLNKAKEKATQAKDLALGRKRKRDEKKKDRRPAEP
ncbi:MAG: PGPGW domain-containing protein [Actinomycetota bacterium]